MNMDTVTEHPKGQPKAFYMLFSIEMWERFGYYGMRALLVLYMSSVFLFSDDRAYATFGAFSSLLFVTPVFGGWIGDRILGYRRALIFGALLLSVGYFLLMIHNHTVFYFGLAMIIVGNGFFKPSPASILGKVYGNENDSLRSAYTLFYMSINIGAFLGMILSGFVAHHFGWDNAFAMSGYGLALSLVVYFLYRKLISRADSDVGLSPINWRFIPFVLIGTIMTVTFCAWLLQHTTLAEYVLYLTCVLAFSYLIMITLRLTGKERDRMIACLLLIVVAIIFCALYFQMPMTMNLYTARNVNRHVFGILIPASTFQSLNCFFIVLLSPFLAYLYNLLKRKNIVVMLPLKFAIGTLLVGIAFLVLNWSQYYADSHGFVSPVWLVLSYFISSFAELLVSALGAAMIAELAPEKHLGLMMGGWYLCFAIAAMLGGQIAQWASIPASDQANAFTSLHIYATTFAIYGWGAIIASVLVFLSVPWINKLIRD